jgi:predicted nuclease of restriction endonuclease-like (RecB) superfamily
LINIDNELERNFYLSESINESWSVRTLKQQKKGDNPPIGIILAKEKDEVMVQYAMYGNNNNLFVSKYQFYLPDLEDLRKIVFKYFK